MTEPDLSAELDVAEEIVMGRVESVETQWGVRYDAESSRVAVYGTQRASEQMARADAAGDPHPRRHKYCSIVAHRARDDGHARGM